MSRDWRAYAHHILVCAGKLDRIAARGSIVEDDILYDAALRNLQTLAEATQRLPDDLKRDTRTSNGRISAAFATFWSTTIWAT
ncbi:hypothetical protein [Asticcacaulis sp. AND118]|uniref:hypothetical protein n=1 Tax=Asticcacaulis sp. AND118 TaxID=2840468 RepID=UPI001CFF6B50|nr:hypothetical protein [Asticcacaulis sp. AND118]UDF05095.1 hypothetical protein LH365_17035 [Asticcacaulis sp. AND118]